jgi:hypothetical protein
MSDEDKKKVKLIRMPDGSIRPTTDADGDIGDVWANQQKIRKQEELAAQLAKQQPKAKKISKRQQKKLQKAAKVQPAPKVISPTPSTALHASTTQQYRNQSTAPQSVKSAPETTQEIAISITMPKVSLPKAPKKHAKKIAKGVTSAPKWVYAVTALVALPAFIITFATITHKAGTKKPAVQGESQAAVADFQTVTPDGDVTNTTSQKVVYDPNKKVASFTDKINGYEVTVSMQKLPDTFKPNIADNVKKVAEQFSATTVLAVDNGSAYLGTSPKGPQSVVGYRGDLLVFIKSDVKIDDKAWASYFNSLK